MVNAGDLVPVGKEFSSTLGVLEEGPRFREKVDQLNFGMNRDITEIRMQR